MPCICTVPFSTLYSLYTEMETTDSSKYLTPTYQTTWCHIPADRNLWMLTIFNYKWILICYNLICGNKMPTRCNRGFYCRSYCLLNMFRAPLCPSSGAQEYYTVVAACGILCTRSNHCIILLSSWWWTWWCPKHVEQAIRSAIKTSVASSWHFISTY